MVESQTKKKKHTWRNIFLSLVGIAILLMVAVFVFFKYYFEDYANSNLVPKLTNAVSVASHGRYSLKMGRISISGITILGKDVMLYRTRYDSSEHGVVVKRLTIDTVYFHGINWWSLFEGKGLYMSSLEINSPKIYTTDADAHETTIDTSKQTAPVAPLTQLPHNLPVISLDSIIFTNVNLFQSTQSHPADRETLTAVSLSIHDFRLDSAALKNQPLFFSKRVDFILPRARYDVADSLFAIEAVNLHGNLIDSLLTIDSFAYAPNMSDDALAAKHKYATGRLSFHCTSLSLRGIDFPKLLTASGISFRKCEIKTWAVDFYTDKRKPLNPHPDVAPMPNELVAKLTFPISLDSVILHEGHLTVRDRLPGSERAGLLFFTHTYVALSPFSTDSSSKNFKRPTRITFNAAFVGEGIVSGVGIFPLDHPTFDLDINAHVTGFDPKKLNPWLIPVERMELSDGVCLNGDIKMLIHSGVASTSVTPRYKGLYMKILPKAPKESSGIIEGLKNLIANTFVLRSNNLDQPGKPAMTGKTVRSRKKTEELFEFIWLSLRSALGAVLGGFK